MALGAHVPCRQVLLWIITCYIYLLLRVFLTQHSTPFILGLHAEFSMPLPGLKLEVDVQVTVMNNE